MSSFQDLGFFFVRNPDTGAKRSFAQSAYNYKTERKPVLGQLCLTPLDSASGLWEQKTIKF